MASKTDNLYITYVEIDRDLLKIWGQGNRLGATYIERQLLQLLPEFERTLRPNSTQIHKGMFCFAKYTDDNYYRARVISRVQGDSVGVLFIDYGNRDIIKLSNIRIQNESGDDVLSKMSEQAEEYYLAGISAPPGGWTKEIISKIRSDICYEEFPYQVVAAVGDQKILEMEFHNEDFSKYLVEKQLASPLSLPVQRHMILTYCSLVSNDVKPEIALSEMPRVIFSPSVPPPNMRGSHMPSNTVNGGMMQLNYEKANNLVNFPVPPPTVQYSSPRHMSSLYRQMNSKNSCFPTPNHLCSQIPINTSPIQPVKPVLNPLLGQKCNSSHQVKENADLFSSNHNIIQLLAEQVKQYIAEDNAKSENKTDDSPHHYISSVLEVGNTYNVNVSYISDGPWSFSIQLLSREAELRKLINELSTTKLVPIKPPIVLGHPCIASSALYENLCRGVVVSISHSAVKVYFVDFGNTEDLPSSSIYNLPSKFFKIRVLSQKFSLSGLQKVAYSEDIKKFFKEVVQNEYLMLRVISLEDDNLPTCELYLKDKNIKRILNEKIRELRNSVLEYFPRVGDTENVVVTWVINPQKFFVQLSKRDGDLQALKKELAMVDTKGQRLTYQELSVGLKCICQYEFDGQWYRAVITSFDSEDAITVFYVDYGNTKTVNISLLRKLDSFDIINQMSNLAIQCGLSEFENKSFDEGLADELKALILDQQLQMTIISSEKELLSVQLFNNGQDVAQLLSSTTSSNVESLETSSQSRNDVWNPTASTESKFTSTFEKENQLPEKSESYEKKDIRIFRGVRSRERNISKAFKDVKNFESTVRSTFSVSKKRFESREIPRNDKEKETHWREQKSNSQNSLQPRGGPRQNKDFDDWNNNSNSKFGGGSRESKLDRGYNDRNDGFKFDRTRGFKQDRDRSAREDRQDNFNFADRKKFEESRGGRERFGGREEKRFDGSRKGDSSRGDDTKRKFDRNHSTLSGSGKPNNSRRPMSKEDIAPPGSKFEERVLPIGSCEKGIVTYYFSPHEFYVQLLAQDEEFKKMMQNIQVYYSDKYSIRDPVKAGDIVIAQFSLDKVLYRAEVVKPSPVTVRYVDYGNQEPVGSKSTWFVSKQFLNLPKQVIKCRLSNIQPIGTDWPPPGSAVDKFFELAEYKCTVLGLEGDAYEITMENVKNGKNVAREIIAASLGRPMSPKLGIPEIDYSLLPNQVLRLYVSHVESSSKFYVVINLKGLKAIENELKTFSENKKNLVPLSEDVITPGTACLLTDDYVSWYRGNIIKTDKSNVSVWFSDRGDVAEVKLDQLMSLPDHLKIVQPQTLECSLHGVSDVNEEEFKINFEFKHHLVSIKDAADGRLSVVLYNDDGVKYDFHKCEDSPPSIEPISQLPIISQKLEIIIPRVKSPKEIYIQSIDDRDELVHFSKLISNYYHSEEKTDFSDEEKLEGRLVAAKPSAGESWCRGRIMSVRGTEDLEVFYIDHGYNEILPRECVKMLDPSFWNLSAFCRKLSLDVDTNLIDVTDEMNNEFLKLCQSKELVAYFKRNEDGLVTEITVDGMRLTDLLKSENLSSAKKEDQFAGNHLIGQTQEEPETIAKYPSIYKAFEENLNGLKVFVRHIDSPEQFWVQNENTITDLHDLQDKLQRDCELVPFKTDTCVNDLVAALFCEKWYRARVVKVESDNVTVQLIDYGNTVIVDPTCSTIKQLTDEFMSVPGFASAFALKGTWGENSTARFEEIILQDENPVSVVVLDESDPGRIVVDLLQNGQSISEMLLQKEIDYEEDEDLITVYITHACSPDDFYIQMETCTDTFDQLTERLADASGFIDPSSIEIKKMYAAKFPDDGAWYRAIVSKVQGEEIEVHFVDYGNTSNVTEIKCLPNDLVDIPNLAENYSLIHGHNSDCWSDAACEKFAEYADGRELKMKVVVNRVNKPLVKLFHENRNITDELEGFCESDERSEVHVTHALSPTDFYVKYVNDKDYKLITEMLENDVERKDLEDKDPGTLCQACFVDDGCWYRAEILKDLNGRYEVLFIDFGNVSMTSDVKRLPAELEKIPPRAMRCSLNLPETNIPESVKEEFINIVAKGDSVFRARVIEPNEINIISLKLNGRILEETLNLSGIPKDNGFPYNGENIPDSSECETDDGKNSKMSLITGDFIISNLADDMRRGQSVGNETDEEKRVKIAIGGVEGFKSDDEKEFQGTRFSSLLNATDNELMEEVRENLEDGNSSEISAEESRDDVLKVEEKASDEVRMESEELEEPSGREEVSSVENQNEIANVVNGTGKLLKTKNGTVELVNNCCSRAKVHKIVPGSISRGEREKPETHSPYQKLHFSERLVPGSVSRGISLESISCGGPEPETEYSPERHTSQSAPNSPTLTRHNPANNYIKIDPNDRLVSGCISMVASLHCCPIVQKVPQTDKIIPGAVNGSSEDF